MQVVCDNCGATYKIPEHKLVKEVNKATCRKCGHRMLIRKPKPGAADARAADARAAEERRQAAAAAVPRQEPARTSEWEEEEPTKIASFDDQGEPEAPAAPAVPPPSVPSAAPAPSPGASSPGAPSPAAPVPSAPAVPSASPGAPAPAAPPKAAPAPAPAPTPAPAAAPAAARSHDPSGDMTLVAVGAVLAVVGALVLAVNVGGGAPMRFGGLFLGLWGGLIALFMVVTSARGRKPASKVLSVLLGTVFAAMGAGLITVIAGGAQALDEGMAQLEAQTDRAIADAGADAGAQGDIDALFAEDDGAADGQDDAADGQDDAADGQDDGQDDASTDAATDAGSADEAAAQDDAAARDDAAGTAEAAPARTAEPARTEPARTEPARTEPARTESAARTAPTRTEPARTEPARTAPAATSSSSSGSSSSGSSTSSGSGSSMSSLPPTVVDTMLKSNKSVKKCLYQEYKRADGNLSSVSMRFKVLPSGKVSSAYVTTSKYKGTELDSCLSAALYTVQFPPFQGEPLTLSWTAAAG